MRKVYTISAIAIEILLSNCWLKKEKKKKMYMATLKRGSKPHV